MNVNLKLQWRPQSAGGARNGIFTNESHSDWNQPKKEACKLQKAVQAPLCTADGYGAISFNAIHAEFWSCFGSIQMHDSECITEVFSVCIGLCIQFRVIQLHPHG